ncbi:hypothetical protein STEG23_035301, partial [Scotinomys teguina]
MGAALVTGPRLASLPRMACGTLRRQTPSMPAQGCHSKLGPPRPVPLKKRGYDVTRNPHLNKRTERSRKTFPVILPLKQHSYVIRQENNINKSTECPPQAPGCFIGSSLSVHVLISISHKDNNHIGASHNNSILTPLLKLLRTQPQSE